MITANGKKFLLFELRLELIPQDPNGLKSLAQRTKQVRISLLNFINFFVNQRKLKNTLAITFYFSTWKNQSYAQKISFLIDQIKKWIDFFGGEFVLWQ